MGRQRSNHRRTVLTGCALAFLAVATWRCGCPPNGGRVTPGPSPTAPPTAATPTAGSGTLYAWANPVGGEGSPLRHADHTMVTSYTAPSACAPPSLYWYSWGSCHATGPGTPARLLAEGPADLDLARCLCQPDVESYQYGAGVAAHGGIDYYGVTGVCHQLANRILAAASTAEPLTVSDAHGYWISRYFYGEYGTNTDQWAARKAKCMTAAAGTQAAMRMAARRTLTLDQDLAAMFDERSTGTTRRTASPGSASNASLSSPRRKRLDDALMSGRLTPRQHAEQVNALVNADLARVAEALGPGNYRTLFAMVPGQPIVLIDPEIAAGAEVRPAR